MNSFLHYFSDPVLRAPMIGSMLMCVAASLVGVIVFLRKESLMGEALSHAAYPGVVLGAIGIGFFFGDFSEAGYVGFLMLLGAFLTALLGMKFVIILQKKMRVKPDSALCFVLSFFFGVGVLLASHVQTIYSNLYRQVQTVFYGQAATMTDQHILIYAVLVLLVVSILAFYRTEFKLWLFDPSFAKLQGVPVVTLERIVFLLVTLSIIIGIRTVGVVLMSAMLIAPAVAARQWTRGLRRCFPLAAFFGLFSASFGTYLSTEVSFYLIETSPHERIVLPTGPVIVLVAALLCIFSLLFAREKGALIRLYRQWKFQATSLRENLLKSLWRHPGVTFKELKELLKVPAPVLHFYLYRLKREGFVVKEGGYSLTVDGEAKGQRIVRLHRLWELYLSDYLGMGPERVHASAEEMEHILTKDLERELTALLKNPKLDPHHQPIPPP